MQIGLNFVFLPETNLIKIVPVKITTLKVFTLINGNHILNWHKLLRPFKTVLFTLYRCVGVRNVILHHFQYKEVR